MMSRFLKKEEVRSRAGSSSGSRSRSTSGVSPEALRMSNGSSSDRPVSPLAFNTDVSSHGGGDVGSPASTAASDADAGGNDDDVVGPTGRGAGDGITYSRDGDGDGDGPRAGQNMTGTREPKLTPMMASLNNLAKEKARAMIRKKFKDPLDLDDIGSLTRAMRKQSIVADSQLNGSVQSKLEALKRAADLMDAASSKLGEISHTMKNIDGRVAASNTTISKFPHLRKVHNVRDNVGKVLDQIDFFAKVPEIVKELKKVIDSEPLRLKEVFLESLRLESLRAALLAEIKVSRTRRSSMVSAGPSANGGMGGSMSSKGTDFSSETGARVREAVETHLHIVPDLARYVRQKVMGTIDRMSEVAATSPSELVCAFEILEMKREYYDRKLKRARDNMEPDPSDYEPLLEITTERMTGIVVSDMVKTFKKYEETAKEKGRSELSGKLAAATEVLSQMSMFLQEVEPCIPPVYNFMRVYLLEFESYWLPKVRKLCSGDSLHQLGPSELLQLVEWFELFNKTVPDFQGDDPTPLKCEEEFHRLSEDMMAEYLDRIKHQVMQWFENIKKLPLEPRRNPDDNTVITTNPEEMFRCLHLQIEVAKEKLPRDRLKDVIMACLQVLRQIQRDTYDALSASYKEIEPELMCATINDNQRMQEKCDEFIAETIELCPSESDRELLFSVLEDVSSEYVEIAVKASSLLAKSLLQCDLEEPFALLFTPDWEQGQAICEAIPATLYECFKDLEEWLPEFFFARVAYSSLTLTVEFYVNSLLKNLGGNVSISSLDESGGANNSKDANAMLGQLSTQAKNLANAAGGGNGGNTIIKFKNELIVANQINQDTNCLLEFFGSYQELLKRGGMSKELLLEVQPLENLMGIVRAPHFSSAKKDASLLFSRFGLDGLKVVLALVIANPSLSKTEKADFERAVKALFYNSGSNSKNYSKVQGLSDTLEPPEEKVSPQSGWGWFGRK